jgi:hypothetical protein
MPGIRFLNRRWNIGKYNYILIKFLQFIIIIIIFKFDTI